MNWKTPICITVLLAVMLLHLAGCVDNQETPFEAVTPLSVAASTSAATLTPKLTNLAEEIKMNHVAIAVGGKTFSATLADNEAARAFAAQLPMTVQMADLNGQEKFYGLPDSLPVDAAERPPTIHSGDIFCWSGNTLVLFYSTFQNSYGGYVRLGTVDDPSGLADALGSGRCRNQANQSGRCKDAIRVAQFCGLSFVCHLLRQHFRTYRKYFIPIIQYRNGEFRYEKGLNYLHQPPQGRQFRAACRFLSKGCAGGGA